MFRRALLANLAGLVAILLAMWGIFAFHYWQETRSMRVDIETVETELLEAYEEGGLEQVTSALTYDGRAEWEPDWLFAIMEEDEYIVRLVDNEDHTIAGFDAIDPSGGWSHTYVDHEDFDQHPVVAFRFGLELDEAELIIGQFVPDRLLILRELLLRGTWLLSLALLPIALVAGLLTSRSVFERLSTISDTAEQVSQGRFGARVPLTGNGDEFDRVGEAVNDMLTQIATLARNLEGVSVGAAHDLKTPVSNLAGRLQLIERDLTNPEATREHVQVAQNHIQALLRTLDALFRLGEVEAGKHWPETVAKIFDQFREIDCGECGLAFAGLNLAKAE
ncbi:MAG: HAMP domain-containing protein, partial [Pseudomonadota bacterium]